MATGTVRFFNDSKGFGLISPDLGGPAIFALASELLGVKKLSPRQRVEFDLREAPTGGTSAARIRVLGQ
jgi:CspA family cold shock protein